MNAIVNVRNLTKSYGLNQVLKGVSFQVARGEVFALLGVNGAGKTTTIECIEGLRRADGGTVELGGSLGVQLQASSIVAECTVKEAVSLFCLWNKTPTAPTLALFDLEQLKNKRYGSLSVGQKKRLHVALALIGDPDIVVLDEPTAGLDIEGRLQLHDEIRAMRAAGKTVLLASHDMAEVEELCDTLAILRDGRIALCGTPAELKSEVGRIATIAVRASGEALPRLVRTCSYCGEDGGYSVFRASNLGEALFEIASIARTHGLEILDVRTERASLEERFMEISKGGDAA